MRHGNPWRETADAFLDTAPIVAAVAVALGLCAAGCASRRSQPEPRVVVLSEHCRTIAPGETVPDLPKGEPVYWLCTPTGLELMMPADSNLPEVPR